MKLKELINNIKDISKQIPNVNYFGEGDVYDLNQKPNIKYGAVVVTQGEHKVDDNFTYYNLVIFYVDRQSSDRDNVLDIQSKAIDNLRTIVKLLEENKNIYAEDFRVSTFKERFQAECAGAFANLTFMLPNSYCAGYDI